MAAQTNFIDIATIWLHAGKGGDGAVSFHREKFVAAGGPDGGDGGRGGDIIFVADDHLSTLMDFRYKRKYTAPDGENGRAKRMSGADGDDLVIRVPRGTVLKEAETDLVVADLTGSEPVIVAKGGRGGWGNSHFATPTRQIPKFAKPGMPGEDIQVTLELKLIADVGLVALPNVGKSTLLNTLTQAGVLAEDKLFATLDPTARALELPDGRKVMLIDTVGLVRRLPHQLVEAFHSTLEEAASADLILSVCDITSPELLEQRAVTERLLEELGVEGTPVITVLNKCDAAPDAQNEPYKGCVRISAKTGYGLPRLLQTIAETLPPQRIRCRLCLPYAEGALLHRLEEQGQIFGREYTAEGTLLDADVEQRDWRLYETYLRTED